MRVSPFRQWFGSESFIIEGSHLMARLPGATLSVAGPLSTSVSPAPCSLAGPALPTLSQAGAWPGLSWRPPGA